MDARPYPVPDRLSKPYWDAARENRLLVQRCARSQRLIHPPVAVCPCCSSEDLEWVPISGRGKIYTFVVMHDLRVRGFEERVPYINVWVEPDEQRDVLLEANLVGIAPSDVVVGLPVEVFFESVGGGMSLPQFRVAP